MIVLGIPYHSFKEKIRLTRKYDRKGKVEVLDGFIYVEMKNPDMND